MNKKRRLTIAKIFTYGLSVDDIEKALREVGKKWNKTSGDWVVKMESHILEDKEEREE